jgi:hypothetical protein
MGLKHYCLKSLRVGEWAGKNQLLMKRDLKAFAKKEGRDTDESGG